MSTGSQGSIASRTFELVSWETSRVEHAERQNSDCLIARPCRSSCFQRHIGDAYVFRYGKNLVVVYFMPTHVEQEQGTTQVYSQNISISISTESLGRSERSLAALWPVSITVVGPVYISMVAGEIGSPFLVRFHRSMTDLYRPSFDECISRQP